MARPRKAGLLYFPLDVDIFDADFKITDLMDRYGPKGLAIYLAILCLVYREGYYLEIPFRSLYAQLTKMIGNRWINDKDFVPEVIGFCGELGLFDADLLSQGVPSEYNFYEHNLHMWVSCKLMWDPDQDFDALMNDFLQGYYGQGAPYIRQYIDLICKNMQQSGQWLGLHRYAVEYADTWLSPMTPKSRPGSRSPANRSISQPWRSVVKIRTVPEVFSKRKTGNGRPNKSGWTGWMNLPNSVRNKGFGASPNTTAPRTNTATRCSTWHRCSKRATWLTENR